MSSNPTLSATRTFVLSHHRSDRSPSSAAGGGAGCTIVICYTSCVSGWVPHLLATFARARSYTKVFVNTVETTWGAEAEFQEVSERMSCWPADLTKQRCDVRASKHAIESDDRDFHRAERSFTNLNSAKRASCTYTCVYVCVCVLLRLIMTCLHYYQRTLEDFYLYDYSRHRESTWSYTVAILW